MTHPTTDMLVAFLDGYLSPVEMDLVAGHLDACDECRPGLSVSASTLASHAGERRRPRWLLR
jgi:predicted anti-sigma-YlaC factor YlaD